MTPVQGRVTSLQRSAGGVPKLPVDRASVGAGGMDGDRQRNLKHHGGPERALCLYAQERLDELAAEGHPVGPGVLGENVTIEGVPWERVQPGTRLRLGGVTVEVTGFAAPCRNIASGFSDGAFTRVAEKVHAGWSRVYVRVLSEGEIAVGDSVALGV